MSLMIYFRDLNPNHIQILLRRYGLRLNYVNDNSDIPFSYWGNPEAGRILEQLYIRSDTPVHSLLHESCHYICMQPEHRKLKNIDAKGSAIEENACCYLQVLLADELHGYNRTRLMQDMDDWGYSFRLGSAQNWFQEDADEVKQWLIQHELIDKHSNLTWKLRQN